jgi:hypothetical protein
VRSACIKYATTCLLSAVLLVPLTRLVISMAASLCGVLATAILWKPGVMVGALLIPVITVFLDQSLGEPLVRAASRGPAIRHSAGQNMKVALVVGLIGFLIVGAALTVPRLADGEPLKATPLFGGQVPVVETDNDGDGIADAEDNCPDLSNAGQADSNGAGRGDACDPDDDNDGVRDSDDNCRAVQNPAQEDGDDDGLGDACDEDTTSTPADTDTDGDTVLDADDNCPDIANTEQENFDGDELGDECDDDDDSDTTLDADDPEPLNPAVPAQGEGA